MRQVVGTAPWSWWRIPSWPIVLLGLGLATAAGIVLDRVVPQTPALAGWLYLMVLLPITLQRGRRIGLLTAVSAVALLILFSTVPSGSLVITARADQVKLIAASVGLIVSVLVLDHVNHGRLAAERALVAQAEQERAEQRISTILENVPDAFYAVDADWRYTYVNRKGAEAVSAAPADLLGKRLHELFPDAVAGPVYATAQRVMAEGVTAQVESFHAPSGRWFEHLIYPHEDGIAVFARDITARKRAEAERETLLTREHAARADAEAAHAQLVQQAERLRAVLTAHRAFSEAFANYPDLLAIIVREVADRIGDACGIRLLGADGHLLETTVSYHVDPSVRALLQDLLAIPQRADEGMTAQVLTTGRPLLLADVSAEQLRAGAKPEYLPYLDQVRIHSVLMVPLRTRGRVIGILGVARTQAGCPYTADDQAFLEDLADRAALAVDNAHLYQAMEQAVRVRDEFLASASHELRTPLSHIKGFVSTLRQTDVEWDAETQADFLAEIERETDRLGQMIGDLLDISRIESGGLDVTACTATPPEQLVAGGLDRVRGVIGAHALRVDVPATLPAVRVDTAEMERVVANLVENAAKYSPPGGAITVAGAVVDGELELRVEDDGPGIPPAYLEPIFEKFVRVRSTEESRVPGAGLGLAICRRIVEAHGGRIWAENRDGGGARFVLRLPLAPARDRQDQRAGAA